MQWYFRYGIGIEVGKANTGKSQYTITSDMTSTHTAAFAEIRTPCVFFSLFINLFYNSQTHSVNDSL